MTPCSPGFPDDHLTQSEKESVARILARPPSPTAPCLTYSRLYWRWVRSSERERPQLQKEMGIHIQVCGCRVEHQKPPDSSWIFAEPDEELVEVA